MVPRAEPLPVRSRVEVSSASVTYEYMRAFRYSTRSRMTGSLSTLARLR